ncbi:MAG: response regulator [Deltaproteobacteria bacterium]|nr:response regulator [Deltaproteobacteria bacterium]
MRVLLVDDEEQLVSTLAERLALRGIEARWVTSSMDALELVKTETFDLAILDVKLPKMNGLELKKRLQTLHPEMKFLFLTGHGSEDDFKIGAAEAGEDFYLVKPVKIESLLDKMNEAMQRQGGCR